MINTFGQPTTPSPVQPRSSLASAVARLLWHGVFLLIAVACFAAFAHFKAEGQSNAAIASLVAAALFGLAPLRDLIRFVFRLEGLALHLVHGLAGLGLVALPLTGVVSGAPLLSRAAMAPFAIMGAAQALMHQQHPRNAEQAAAMQRFAASLPELAQLASPRDLSSPANARRAVAAVSDLITKAQALGETELKSDPGFQGALRQVSARFGASLGLDAVDLALAKLAANPATAAMVPQLRQRLESARRAVAGSRSVAARDR